MSIKAETKRKLMLYMQEHIDNDDAAFISKTTDAFGVSRTSAYRYLTAMKADGTVVANDSRRCGYQLKETVYSFRYDAGKRLNEDRIYVSDIKPIFKDHPKNVYDILQYIFTEMMNNAIEHAEATEIAVTVVTNNIRSRITIEDNGIGIFKKIQNYFQSKGEDMSLDEAVNALLPGKLTTAAQNHSGEGIFFSSRAADHFVILSGDRVFRKDNFSPDQYEPSQSPVWGTSVTFSLSNFSPKLLKDVFDTYSDPDKGFFRTQIPIANMFPNGDPVSRSEARRLASFLTRFEEVTHDFKNVESIGQAFTHELFIVFRNNNPQTQLHVENACDDVQRMISRVINTK